MKIEIAVVGHDESIFPSLNSKILKKAILHKLDFDNPIYSNNSLGESRFFLANNFFSEDCDVVGCLTASWDRKYFPNRLDNIENWPQYQYIHSMIDDKSVVLCTTMCYGKYAKNNAPLWEKNFQQHFRKVWKNSSWIQKNILDITGLEYDTYLPAPYANQIICNKSLFHSLCIFIKSIISDVIDVFGSNPKIIGKEIDPNRTLAYIMEEICMLWWSKQNIKYIQCAKIKPGWYK